MKTKIYSQPEKSSVENLVSSILFGYTMLQDIASKKVEEHYERGALKARLVIPISLKAELGELMLKTFSVNTMVNISGPGIITANQHFEGLVPNESQLEDYKNSVVKKFEDTKTKLIESLSSAERGVESKIERMKAIFASMKKNAKFGNNDAVMVSVIELSQVASWRTRVDLDLLIETAIGLIELSKEVQHYTGLGVGVEIKLEEALEEIRVREIWFKLNKKEILKPLCIAAPVFPSGTFSEKLDEKFLAEEFVRQYMK